MVKRAKSSENRADYKVIGNTMRALRIAAGLTLYDIAEHLDVSYQQIQKYESGANRLPLGSLPVLCDLFGVPADVLLSGLSPSRGRVGDDLIHIQQSLARVADVHLRQKILRVVDILAT